MQIFTHQQISDQNEYLLISNQGFRKLMQIQDPQDPIKNVLWTTDLQVELPIRMKKFDKASYIPFTLYDAFQNVLQQIPQAEALKVKRNNQQQTWTFEEYYRDTVYFANALLATNITENKSVNIIGFNSPEWMIAFYGSIWSNNLPVGVYTTNGPDGCWYVADHSEAEVIVVEDYIQIQKYLQIWDKLPQIKLIIVYSLQFHIDQLTQNERAQIKGQIIKWEEFLKLGQQFQQSNEQILLSRINKITPGKCCTLVYTSGTTGNPKGVMLSHDNYTWTSKIQCEIYQIGIFGKQFQGKERLVSYLPLSHVAAQIVDIIGCIVAGVTIYFAQPTALQGTLIESLQEIRPTLFVGVPRIFEKIEERMKFLASQAGFIAKILGTWAKAQGVEGTFNEVFDKPNSLSFFIAKKLIYNAIKKKLGLDQTRIIAFGAGPLSASTRQYFMSLNILLRNIFGMSETSGPQASMNPKNYKRFDLDFFNSCGQAIDGTDLIICQPDKDGNGEICFKGRNRFMGYFKNEEETRQAIDEKGYLHSGDIGKLDKNGNVTITGRIKELLITAGGENIAPLLIEQEIKTVLPFLSNVVIIGDMRKYLTALLTLKQNPNKEEEINDASQHILEELGSKATLIKDAKNDPIVLKKIEEGINQANQKAISNAHHVKKWHILDRDFSLETGEVTPTMKLKRNVINQMYEGIIESLYMNPSL